MIVGGLLIVVGLFFTDRKTQAYTAWCDKKVGQAAHKILTNQIMAAASLAAKNEQQEQEYIVDTNAVDFGA